MSTEVFEHAGMQHVREQHGGEEQEATVHMCKCGQAGVIVCPCGFVYSAVVAREAGEICVHVEGWRTWLDDDGHFPEDIMVEIRKHSE